MNEKKECELCQDREWMVLQMNPLNRALDLVAPCVACSGDKNLYEIEKRRGISLQRDSELNWYEELVQ